MLVNSLASSLCREPGVSPTPVCTVRTPWQDFAQTETQNTAGSKALCTLHYEKGEGMTPWLHRRARAHPGHATMAHHTRSVKFEHPRRGEDSQAHHNHDGEGHAAAHHHAPQLDGRHVPPYGGKLPAYG